ncbi:hypothetical protein TNCV_4086141 [Trichonephila clavipes]|nr:hypothetical protein TNCV_4086141 [Trichonephila clavipes]
MLGRNKDMGLHIILFENTPCITRLMYTFAVWVSRIGGIPELKIDDMTLADSRGGPTDLEVKVLLIIAGSIVDVEVVNMIIDSIITAVDRVVPGMVLSEVRMVQTEWRTIWISSLRMTPVDLPYVPILLNETFITALWDTGAEKSFISEEVYRRCFS